MIPYINNPKDAMGFPQSFRLENQHTKISIFFYIPIMNILRKKLRNKFLSNSLKNI
jgi:hypothetical protein